MSGRLRLVLLALLCLALAAACTRRPASTADVPRSLPAEYQISVAPFTQPTETSQLILGYIPEMQGRIARDELVLLDRAFRHILQTGSKRNYTFVPRRDLPADSTAWHAAEQPQALPKWLAYGRGLGAQYLLIPQVLDWHQREGSGAGVVRAAHVRLEFFLVRVEDGTILKRTVFEEKQVGLTENLLTVGSFFKRRGVWVTAEELAEEAMQLALEEMRL